MKRFLMSRNFQIFQSEIYHHASPVMTLGQAHSTNPEQ